MPNKPIDRPNLAGRMLGYLVAAATKAASPKPKPKHKKGSKK